MTPRTTRTLSCTVSRIPSCTLTRPLAAAAAALLLATGVHASPLMEIDAEQLVRGAGYVKTTLNLTPNQQTLWQQVASRSAGLLRARQVRRDKLQATLKAQLQLPAAELRELALAVEQETATSAAENQALREQWLALNDALDDQQRALVNIFLVNQLERVDAPERGPERAAGERRGEHPDGGQRRPKPGADTGGARF
jgi:hypothetical protein